MKRILKLAGLPTLIAAGVLLWLGPTAQSWGVQVCTSVLITTMGTLLLALCPTPQRKTAPRIISRPNAQGRSMEPSRPLGPNEYSLRAVVDRSVAPFRTQAAAKGVQLVIGLPDSIPDRYAGTGAGLEKTIAKQLADIVRVTRRGFIVFEVKSVKQPDGRMRLRFRADAMLSYSHPKAANLEPLPMPVFAPVHQPEPAAPSPVDIGSIHGMCPYRA